MLGQFRPELKFPNLCFKSQMKNFALSFTLFSVLFFHTMTLHPKGYGMAGCGFGSLIPAWKNDISQVLAATTNASTSSQTFGITSGTLNCTDDGIVRLEKAQEVFVHYNQIGLESEFALGKGERINAIATLLGCPSHGKEIGNLAKKNFDKIITPETRKDSTLLLNILKKEIGNDSELSLACNI